MVETPTANKKLEKIFAATVTPMTDSGDVNYSALKELVKWQINNGVEGCYICGSSGEGLLLTIDERKKILDTVLESAEGKVPVIAHTGTIRTEDVIDLSRHAKSAGADAVSMIPPYYFKFSWDEVCGYYEDVLDSTDIPVIIYNIPAFTGIAFSKDNAERVLSHPRVIGIKHTSMNFYDLERMKTDYPEKVYINGYDEVFLSGLSAGASAAIGTTINIFPSAFIRIREHFKAGEMAEAQQLQSSVNSLIEDFLKPGIFNAVKYALILRGIDCGSCRKPFKALTSDDKKAVENCLNRLNKELS